MKKFLLYLLLVITMSAGCSFLFYWKLNTTSPRTSPIDAPMNYAGNNHDHNDILFIGNSRMLVQVNPKIIDSVTGLSSYNCSLDGSMVPYYYMILKRYLSSHPAPECVVMNIDFTMLNVDLPYNYTDYFPYLNDTMVYNSLSPYSYKIRFKFLQKFLLFERMSAQNDQIKLSALSGFIEKQTLANPDTFSCYDYKGFTGRKEYDWKSDSSFYPLLPRYSAGSFDVLSDINELCKEKSIKLIFVYAPLYYDYRKFLTGHEKIEDAVESYTGKNGIPFFNYTELPLCYSKEYFYNREHLNLKGANEFSEIIGADLKKALQPLNNF